MDPAQQMVRTTSYLLPLPEVPAPEEPEPREESDPDMPDGALLLGELPDVP
ncbi:hypothetical protein [Noviherbaspirillum saxi]|uniref:hypothetical protein n=1 Tax=Noviherbaspirillum saxi TaxID=2320863 RepID=UPI0013146A38|nr:hypothetical protein [Noviherbaspirillum saxi]